MEGAVLAREGYSIAEAHANAYGEFTALALAFFVQHCKTHGTSGAAEARLASNGFVPEPPDARAWGAIPIRAQKLGCVEHAGHAASTDPKSHATPRSMWRFVNDLPKGMEVFWNDIKEEAAVKAPRKPRGPIPIESLQKMGCEVCPRDSGKGLASPKMKPEGPDSPSIYLLALQPTGKDDERGESFSSDEGREIASRLSQRAFNRSRTGYGAQCHDAANPDEAVIACCRNRVVGDIERAKPKIVVGIGDEVLRWATGLPGGTIPFRGSLIACRFGSHVCWFYPVIEPKYIHSKRYGKSEFETAVEFDCKQLDELIFDRTLQPPTLYESDFDKGITMITGEEPGDMVRLEEAFHRMLNLPRLALDIETTGLSPYMTPDPRILSAAVGTFDDTVAFNIEDPAGWGTEQRMRKVSLMFGHFVAESGKKVCHHAGFEQQWLAFKYGSYLLRRTEFGDTMAMAYAFDERKGTKSLDVQTRIHFGFNLKAQSPVDVRRPNWWLDYTSKQKLRYNGMDTKWTDKLASHYDLAFLFDGRARDIYERRLRTVPTLVKMTEGGLPIDFDYAVAVDREIKGKRDEAERKLRLTPEVREYTAKFGTFAPGNTDHVLKLYRDVMHRDEIEVVDSWGRTSMSTGEEQLSAMPPKQVPSAALELEWRQLDRNITTYLGPLLDGKLTGADDIWHSEYSQLDTVTSRLNSPAHNWPKHKHAEVRGAVCAPKDHWFVAADEGQIEFRVAHMLSGDENGIKYCWTGYDCHGYWGQRMLEEYPRIVDVIVDEYKIDWDELGLKTLRQHTKNGWVFPMIFGSKAKGCAARMQIPVDIAERLAEEFWDEFKGVKRWQDNLIKFYEKHLYVETMGGFRRHGAMSVNELINMPIQGTTAEIVIDAMNCLSEQSDAEERPDLQPRFNGHDDLSFIVHDRNLEGVIADVTKEMCRPRFDYINVPLIVEVSVGERWNKLKKVGDFSSVDLYRLTNPYS